MTLSEIRDRYRQRAKEIVAFIDGRVDLNANVVPCEGGAFVEVNIWIPEGINVSYINIRVEEDEWRLIMRSLAMYSGVKVGPRNPEEKKAAGLLNKSLLMQRIGIIRQSIAASPEDHDPDGTDSAGPNLELGSDD
jgi:hypothetical protein